MFCENCGGNLEANVKFCPRCGKAVEVQNNNLYANLYGGMQIIENLYKKEKMSLYIWIGVVCYQILAGFVLPSAWGFALWNCIACYQTYQFAQKMKQQPVGIYKHYEEALTGDVIFLVLNLLLGGVIGAVGAGYDLYVRKYAMDNKEILLSVENNLAQQGGVL